MATVTLGNIKFNWKGAWNSGTAYVVDDVVSLSGSSYVCIQAGTNQNPSTATAYWEQMSSAGTNGTDLTTTLTTQGDIVYRDGSGLARLAAGTSGLFLKTQGSGSNPVWAAAGGSFENNLFHIVHEEADGTNGGSTTHGSYQKRTLNTIKVNQISASASSSVITLAAGDYLAQGWSFYTNSNYVQQRLRDTTNSADLVIGQNTYTEGYASALNTLAGKFTLSGSANVELQYWTTTSYSNTGLGFNSPAAGNVNRFADLMIWKL